MPLNLLFLSNFYPPHGRGGYEEWCSEVAAGLVRRGHRVTVLTSRHGGAAAGDGGPPAVHRKLYLEMELTPQRNALLFYTERPHREAANLAVVRHVVAETVPDAVVIWGMWDLARAIPALVEELCGTRTIYYFGDYWPALPGQWWYYWEGVPASQPARWLKGGLRAAALRRLAKEPRPSLRFPHALFPSAYMHSAYEEAGIVVGTAAVVPGGVDLAPYRQIAERPVAKTAAERASAGPSVPARILTAARLIPDKGVDTAIRALGILADRHGRWHDTLTIAGSGDPAYVAALRRLAEEIGVEERVRFVGWVPKEQMPTLYAAHDLFVFSANWPEPFGRVLVESMAAGLPVVGASVGGASEILCDGDTGLVFPSGEVVALAAQIARLAQEPGLRAELAQRGRTYVLDRFDTTQMTIGIERYLAAVAEGA